MIDYDKILCKYYTPGSKLYELLIAHSRQVAEYAMDIINRKSLAVDKDFVYAAAMLHDIGVCATYAPSIYCTGTEPYLMHGLIGAEYLRKENMEAYARVCERHIGVGLTASEIEEQRLPLPARDFLPETMEEKLVCYADNFFSKSRIAPARTVDEVSIQMQRYGAGSVSRLEAMISLFE